jgi:pyruvate formate lyase activating enzyme
MTEEIQGRIHSIESFGAVDGPGIRCVLFMQGCPLRCKFCHNPDTWPAQGGQNMTPEQALKRVVRYKPYIQKGGGVTLSGGEPLLQSEFCLEFARLAHKEGLHVALDTSGALPLDKVEEALREADLLLLDIKAMDAEVCRELTGQDNRNALAILNWCEQNHKPVWIRHVMVPGITLEETRLDALARYIAPFQCVERVELLPFHKLGEQKWAGCGAQYELYDTPEPTDQQVQRAKEIFRNAGVVME